MKISVVVSSAWRPAILCVAITVSIGTSNVPAHAACPDGTLLAAGSNSRAFADGAGGGYVVWESGGPLYALRVDSSGRVVSGWPASGVQVTTQTVNNFDTIQFDATKDSANRLVVVWATSATGTSKVNAQRISPSGVREWGTNGKNVITGTNPEARPVIAADLTGGVFIAFELSPPGPSKDVHIQRFDNAGNPILAAGKVVCNASNDQYQVRITHTGGLGNPFAVVCWTDRRNGNDDIFAQLLNGSLGSEPTNGVALVTASGTQNEPAIDGTTGHAYVFWKDERAAVPGRADVYGQHIIGSSPTWGTNGLLIASGSNGYFIRPTSVNAHADNAQGVLLTFLVQRASENRYELHAYKLFPGGQLYPNYPPVYCGVLGLKWDISVVGDDAFGFISSWRDRRSGNDDVYAIKRLPNATVAPGWVTNGTILSAAAGNQTHTSIASAASGGALVTWTSGSSIMEQVVSSGGVISTVPPTPTGVMATDCVGTDVTVTWNDVCGETEYRIYRDGMLAGTAPMDATSWADPSDGTPPPGNYTYCVRSYRVAGGESPGACDGGCMPVPPPPDGFVDQTLPTTAVAGLAVSPQGKPSITYVTPSTNRPQFAARANNTWTSSQIEDLPAHLNAVAVDAAGTAHVAYLDRTNPNPTWLPLRYARRAAGGGWVPEMVDASVQGFAGTRASDLALGATGTVWVAYADGDGLVRAAYRGPTGGWTPEQAGPGGGSLGEEFVNLAISSSGSVFVSYCDGFDKKLQCAIRTPAGAWSRETVDTPPSNLNAIANSLQLTTAGQPVIAYYVPGQDQLKVATRIGTNNWSIQPVASSLSSTTGVNPELDIDPADNLHLVYNNWNAQTKIRAKRTGPTAWTFQTLNAAVASDKHFVRVSAGGKPRIATGNHFWDSAWEIVTPVPSASWFAGSSQLVAWAGTGNANVDARMNPSSPYQSLATNVAADEVFVTVPDWTTPNADVRVSRISPSAADTVGPINVSVPPPVLTSPAGGENWPPGSIQNVTWTGGGTVKIELFADATVGASLTGPSVVLAAAATGGSFPVAMPADIATRRARIQISRTTGPPNYSFSPPFHIVTAPVAGIWSYDPVDGPNHGWNQSDMCRNGGNGVHAVYFDYQGGSNLKMASKLDKTQNWVIENVDTTDAVGSWPSVVRGGNGTLHVAYYDHKVGSAKLYYKKKPAGGQWTDRGTPVALITVVQGDCSIALQNDVPHIAYNTGNQGGMQLKVVKQNPNGSWSQLGSNIPAQSPHHITLRGNPFGTTWWVSFIDMGGNRMNLWYWNGFNWFDMVVEGTVQFATPGPYTTAEVALDALDQAYLAYTIRNVTSGGQTLIFQPPGDTQLFFGAPIPIDTTLGTISSLSMEFAGFQDPRIGYVGNGVVKLAAVTWTGSDWSWIKGAVDATGNMDSQVSLVVTGADDRWLFYRDVTNTSMRASRPYWVDTVPPAAPTYLNSVGGCDSLYVDWQATGDDGMTGLATAYDLRWSGNPITTDALFNAAAAVPVALPIPHSPGSNEHIGIYMGNCSQHKYFAIKVRDEAGNLSPLTADPQGSQTACIQPPLMCAEARTEVREQLPARTDIVSLRPNPTSRNVDIDVALARAEGGGPLDLAVFDVAGRRVATLHRVSLAAGRHLMRWNLKDSSGHDVSAGIYFIRLSAGSAKMTKRVVVVR
jgi:hypothetical protein